MLKSLYLSFAIEYELGRNKMKEDAIEKYKAALLLPRKKKKIAKKHALLMYSLACWEPFSD